MKKYFKVILSFMAFAFFSFIFAISPSLTTYAAMNNAKAGYNVALNAIKMPKNTINVKDGEKLEVPLLSNNWNGENPTNYTIRVVDPSGQNHDYVVSGAQGASNLDGYFTLNGDKLVVNSLNNGRYDIMYIITEGEGATAKKFYSKTYSVEVKNVSYALNFSYQDGDKAGLNMLLPANMKVGDTRVELPVGHVDKIVNDDTFATGETAKIVVMKNGLEIEQGTEYVSEGGKYYLDPVSEGVYTIEYTYNKGSNPPTKTFTVVVSDKFEKPGVSDIAITTPTMPTIELGMKDIELPKLTVSDNINDNVDYNLLSIKITNANNTAITKTLSNNDYTFDMTKEFFGVNNYKDLLGNYEITYTIEDAYGNPKSITVVVKNVKDSTDPQVYMAYDYEVKNGVAAAEFDGDTVKKAVDTNYEADLKAKYGYGEILLPAIYAEDLVSDYSDFTFIRYIQNTNTKTIYYLDNKKMEDGQLVDVEEGEGYNYSADANIGVYNKAVKFSFMEAGEELPSNAAGEYELGYYVVAKTTSKQENYVYATGKTKYKFTILSGSESTQSSQPTVEINNLKNYSSINSDATVAVNITKKSEKDAEGKDIDARLNSAVFYYYSTTSANSLEEDIETALQLVTASTSVNDFNAHKCAALNDVTFVNKMVELGYEGFDIATPDEDNKTQYNVTLNGFTDQDSVSIVAIAMSDSNNFDIDTRTLNINNLAESHAPTWSIVDDGDLLNGSILMDAQFEQGETVTLPTVQFTDDWYNEDEDEDVTGDSSLALNVSYYIDSPETSTGVEFKAPTGKNLKNNKIIGGTINTTKAGTYYVVYTATDDAGNTSVVYFTFVVTPVEDPILTVGVVENEDISYSGNTITGDLGSVITFDPAVYSADGTNDITATVGVDYTIDDGGKGLDWETTGDDWTFRFNDEGEYTIKFTAEGAIDKVFNISISKPKLVWNFDIAVQESGRAGEVITLPERTANQGNKKAVVSVSVVDPDGNDVTVEQVYVDTATIWQFTPSQNGKGTYTVTYTAETSDSKIKQEYEIRVGDNQPPVLTMANEENLSQDIVYDGEHDIEYKVLLNKTKRTLTITAVSNGVELYSYDTKLNITDKDDEGKTHTITSWSKLNIELLKDGSAMTYESDEDNTNYKYYTISSKGQYTLKLTITDTYKNEGVKEIKFNVVTKTEAKENNDVVIGTVLIILSLVILAGVILFFTFTGKNGGSKKTKLPKAKKELNVAKEENVEETKSTVAEEPVVEAETVETADENIVIEEAPETSESNEEQA